MDIAKVYAVYFSPTGSTGKVAVAAAKGTGLPGAKIDLTPWKSRMNYARMFNVNEIVVAGMPVYNGRLPGKIDNFFTCLKGNNTPAIAVVVYGNRDYEDALIELKVRLEERSFKVIAGAAFIGEHTFSKNVAAGRPNEADLAMAREFGRKAIDGIDKAYTGTLTVKGNIPYQAETFDPTQVAEEYTGWGQVGTTADCSFCGQCEENCPWNAITIDDNVITNYSKCLRCFRCMKYCPSGAKKVIDQSWSKFIDNFEGEMEGRVCQPEMFFGE
jgi:ferredoxin